MIDVHDGHAPRGLEQLGKVDRAVRSVESVVRRRVAAERQAPPLHRYDPCSPAQLDLFLQERVARGAILVGFIGEARRWNLHT